MQNSDFISENEACNVTGVTPRTLQRFAEAGYLQLEKDLAGLCHFSKHELEALFGLKADFQADSPEQIKQTEQSETQNKIEAEEFEQQIEKPSFTPTAGALLERLELVRDDHQPQTAISEQSSNQHNFDAENSTLKNLIKIQEKLLDARDDEISDLKEQRDWLKQRIEKLEQKAERDQLLLLSEAQTVKSLVALQQSKKSSVRLALEYFGFVAPSAEQQASPNKATPQH